MFSKGTCPGWGQCFPGVFAREIGGQGHYRHPKSVHNKQIAFDPAVDAPHREKAACPSQPVATQSVQDDAHTARTPPVHLWPDPALRARREPQRHEANCSNAASFCRASACLISAMKLVTGISRGQYSVQLKMVRQRKAPQRSHRMVRRSSAPSSRLSKRKRCALTSAAGPTHARLPQVTGRELARACTENTFGALIVVRSLLRRL